jgi:formylmethanofuran dehydrogenase subunit E
MAYIDQDTLDEVVQFHGHLCPGLLLGIRMANAAMAALGKPRSEDEEIFSIFENDSCALDAVQYLTGCTAGKGNLFLKDYGKQVLTLAARPSGRGVRVVFTGDRLKPLRADGSVDRKKFVEVLRDAPDDEILKIEHVTVEPPPKARIFATLTCSVCGEGVMEPRATMVDGKPVCPSCQKR